MFTLLLSSLILTAAPDEPTEIIGSAATPDGKRKEVIVIQPNDSPNPFGYIAPYQASQPVQPLPPPYIQPKTSDPSDKPMPLVSQSSVVNPKDMNPLHYRNQIENTIYQSGDRLIDVQSIPLKDISSAVEPNLQPTISDYPTF